ncbi:MAG TPA: family 16 glycoside hydrolase [Planctomycetota bacterium]|nr:family 16 glycoside hydrolase [Planctomycetota bacterium]
MNRAIAWKTAAAAVAAALACIAIAGCKSAPVILTLPAEPASWQAKPAGCARTAGDEIILSSGRIIANGFSWADSEIEFSVFDPGETPFAVTLYDSNYAQVREMNANKWFTVVKGKSVPLAQTIDTWPAIPVHVLMLGGDKALADKGMRAFGGIVTTEMKQSGDVKTPFETSFSENFKIGQWNTIRLVIQGGKITAWVNGEEGQSIQCDQHLGGPFGFEVLRGELRLKDIRLTR